MNLRLGKGLTNVVSGFSSSSVRVRQIIGRQNIAYKNGVENVSTFAFLVAGGGLAFDSCPSVHQHVCSRQGHPGYIPGFPM